MHGLWRVVLAATLATAAFAQVKEVSSPVFRGIMGLGKTALVLFEVPGQSGNWQGGVGQTVPGTTWKILAASLSQGQITLDVGGGKRIVMAQGDTYDGGAKSVKAPEVARPENKPAGEYRPPTPEEDARNRYNAAQRLAAASKAAGADSRAKAEAAFNAQPPPASADGLIETVDVSTDNPPLNSLAKPGFTTAVMVTSKACGPCQRIHPQLEELPTKKAHSRVVFADIGVTPQGRINFGAPFFQSHKLDHVPYVFLMDEAGTVHTEGDAAWGALRQWVPHIAE